ncbi:hypothetical protein FRC01_014802 [Tulasnella sp. 417]|nr:hypothetical protein FRC01_014802 [Tulasnella sp. 417]
MSTNENEKQNRPTLNQPEARNHRAEQHDVPPDQTVTDSPPPADAKEEHWTKKEFVQIPHNNLFIVFPGLMLSVFLAALDQTIVGVALPTIAQDLGSSSGYSWVGSAYLLAASALAPLTLSAGNQFSTSAS